MKLRWAVAVAAIQSSRVSAGREPLAASSVHTITSGARQPAPIRPNPAARFLLLATGWSRAGPGRRQAAGTLRAGSTFRDRGDQPAVRVWATRASRACATISPESGSAAALTRSRNCPACVTSRPARVKSASRRRFGQAAPRDGGSASVHRTLQRRVAGREERLHHPQPGQGVMCVGRPEGRRVNNNRVSRGPVERLSTASSPLIVNHPD